MAPEASACQEELRQLAPEAMGGGLDRFYASLGYPCLWTREGVPTPQARAITRAVNEAALKGLDAEDYALPVAEAAGVLGPTKAAQWDLAFTQATMRFVSDLSAGRVNRATNSDSWNLSLQVARLASASDAEAMLREEVEPAQDGYRRTVKALERYLSLAPRGPAAEPDLAELTEAVKPGDTYAGAAALAARLTRLGDLEAEAAAGGEGVEASGRYQGPLVDAVKRFQARHGLEPDGVVGSRTLRELNVPIAGRVRQLQLALERWRGAAATGKGTATTAAAEADGRGRSIEVNIPEFRLRALEENGGTGLEMKVVVGGAARHQTPVFSANMTSVTFHPYWNVPWSIQRKEIMPEMERNNGYLAEHGLEAVRAADGSTVSAAGMDAAEMMAGLRAGKLRLRQVPGPQNALGLIAFIMPNEYAVYLHDSPQRHLYARVRRDFSHGCIRVEDPVALAGWVLRGDPRWTPERIDEVYKGSGTTQTAALLRAIPVRIVYRTVVVDSAGGPPRFLPDIYGLDAALERQLSEVKRQAAPMLTRVQTRRPDYQERTGTGWARMTQ